MTRFTRITKRVASVMALVMLLGCLNVWPGATTPRASAADSDWPAAVLKGDQMPFRPTASLVTSQNPPDFSWPHIDSASNYHVRVARDANMTMVEHEKSDVKVNFYNFPVVFESGVWYWQVRYETASGWSGWSTARKFRITTDAVPFPVPSLEELMDEIDTAHPRVWTNPDDLQAFRDLKLSGNSQTVYNRIRASVMGTINNPPPDEPTFPYMDGSVPTSSPEFVAAQQVLRGYVDGALSRMMETAFIYLLTGEANFGQSAKAQLLNVATWDHMGSTKFEIQDQVHRAIAYRSAIVYDWVYDLLSDTEKAAVETMVKDRTTTLVNKFVVTQPINRHPYDSHGWTIFGYIGLISTIMMHEIPEAEEWFERTVPAYINMLPPWGGEDGSWSQGTGYWQWSSSSNKELMDVLLSAGAIDLYKKAFSRNEGMYPLYMFPHGSPTGVFGNDAHYTPGWYSVNLLNRLSQMYDDERLKWEAEAIGAAPQFGLTEYFYGDESVGSMPPVDLAKGKWFPVTGVTAMHSELWNTDRTSLYFRSSPYGSYSHSNADQNSFIIHSFGEPLAVKAGHYDYYDSVHHAGFAKQTFSANAITYDGRKGQQTNSIDSDGNILGFVTHADFDAVSGDATVAYSGGLTKAVRHILYVRPSMYVVIDDLATAAAGGSNFEWNLHTDEQLIFHTEGKGATVTKGDAELDVRFHGSQASALTTSLENRYLNAVGTEVAPGGSFAGRKQLHAAFVTPKVNSTKLVATMEPHKRGTAAQEVESEEFGTYVRLVFDDGTTVYVRTGNSGTVTTADGIVFDGAAAAVKGESVLLVDGVSLAKDGVMIVESDQRATVAFGDKLLSVSAQADAEVVLNASGTTVVRDSDSEVNIPLGGDVSIAMNSHGVHWTTAGNTLTMQVEKGQRNFKLNDAPAPGPLPDVTLQTEIDGGPGEVTLKAYRDIEGVSVAWGSLTNESNFYQVLEAPAGLTFRKHGSVNSVLLEANAPILLKGAPGVLRLKSVGTGDPLDSSVIVDHQAVQTTWAMEWQEAETFKQWGGKAPTIYTTRPFLSGGAGVSDWDQTGQWMKWTLNVPRTGTYDLVLKYEGGWIPSGGPREEIVRYLQLGNELNYFEAAQTTDFGADHANWRVVRVETGQQLTAGPIDLTMWHQNAGMNLDWIGLVEVKDDEIRPSVPGAISLVSQTDDSVTVSWEAATDNVAIKEYVVYVDGVRKMTSTTHSATITGLATGGAYVVSVRAVDTSDNLSNEQPSASHLTVSLADQVPPQWGNPALRAELLFSNTARLAWEPATDVGKIKEYRIHRLDGADPVLTGKSSVAMYDVTGLTPGGTYSFRIEAVDEYDNVSIDNPEITVTLPLAADTKAVYEGFDDWQDGNKGDDAFWRVRMLSNPDGIVQVVPLEDLGGKGLQAVDSYVNPTDEYASGPRFWREMAPFGIGGKATVETKFKYDKINHTSGNFTLDLAGNNRSFAGFLAMSDGGFGFQTAENNSPKSGRLTQYNNYTQPENEWVTVRFDIDFAAKKYDLTVQADSLRGYGGSEIGVTRDSAAGTVSKTDIPFVDNASNGFEMFRVTAQRFTGKYTFDYMSYYLTPPTLSANSATFDKNIENTNAGHYQDVVTELALNGAELVNIKNGAETLSSGTDYTLNGSTLTIAKEYLVSQPLGTTVLTLDFEGIAKALKIAVSDSTVIDSMIDPVTASFDKNTANAADVSVGLTLNGNTLSSIANGATTLTEGNEYIVDGSTVSIKKGYLSAQAVGTTRLTFNFSAGSTQTLEITVKDTTPTSTPTPTPISTPISTPTPTPTPAPTTGLMVDGKIQNAGKVTTAEQDGRSVTTLEVDEETIERILETEGKGAVINLTFGEGSDTTVGVLGGELIKNLENGQAVIELRTDNAVFTIPAADLNIDAILEQLGGGAKLQDLNIEIEIAEAKPAALRLVDQAAASGDFTLVVPALEFTIRAVSGERILEVNKFSSYVERKIAIPDGVDPSRITTGVVVEPDGTVRHVPTKVVEIDGQYYAIINSLTNSIYSVVSHSIQFADATTHWAMETVNDMGSRMIVKGFGDGTFKPNQDMTRAEFAAIIVRGLGLMLESGEAPFSDVQSGSWYHDAILTASAYNLINGFDDGTFRPNDKITREQAMTIIAKAMTVSGLKAELHGQDADGLLDPFGDAELVAAWAEAGVKDTLMAGIVNGRDGKLLDPKAYITRAEVAQMVRNLLIKSELI